MYHRGKSRKPISAKDTHQQEQIQGKKLDYKATAKKEVTKESVSVAKKQSLDEKIKKKPTPKSLSPKEAQTKSESEDVFSSPSISDDQSELHLHESTRMKEHHKVHPNTDGNEIENERAVKTKKITQGTKPKGFCSSDADMREQSKEGKTKTIVNEKTKKGHKLKYLEADGTSPRKEKEEKTKKKGYHQKGKLENRTYHLSSTETDYSSSEREMLRSLSAL